MRKLLFLVVVCCCATPAQATLLVSESFNYNTPGVLTGNVNPSNGQTWTQMATAGGARVNVITIENSQPLLPYTGRYVKINGTGNTASNGSADRLPLGQLVAAPPLVTDPSNFAYYSFYFRVDALTGSNALNGGFLAALTTQTVATNPTTITAKLQARIDPLNAANYNLGIFNNRNAVAASLSWSSQSLLVGQTYFIVAGVELRNGAGNDISRLWINPGNLGGATPPTPSAEDLVFATNDVNVSQFLLRQSPAPVNALDQARVGTDWASVTAVPEPSSVFVFLLVGAALSAAHKYGPAITSLMS